MSKRNIECREAAVYERTKRLRSTLTRRSTLNVLAKHVPTRSNSLFEHLNLDVRNRIYDYVVPYLRPFDNSKDYAGFFLACRQAKEELEAATYRCYMKYLRAFEADMQARLGVRVLWDLPPRTNLSRLAIAVPLQAEKDTPFRKLSSLHLRELSIHLTRQPLHNTTLREAQASLRAHTRNYKENLGWSSTRVPFGLIGKTKFLNLSFDRDNGPDLTPLSNNKEHPRELEYNYYANTTFVVFYPYPTNEIGKWKYVHNAQTRLRLKNVSAGDEV